MLSVANFIWLSASLPTTKAAFVSDVTVVCAAVIATFPALAVIPFPPITFKVTSPEVPPPVIPAPATTLVMSPSAVDVPKATQFDPS